jgi:hypothetical protein
MRQAQCNTGRHGVELFIMTLRSNIDAARTLTNGLETADSSVCLTGTTTITRLLPAGSQWLRSRSCKGQ